MGTPATDIIQYIDNFSGELTTYKEVENWHDGTSMNDSKCDGVIYRKKGSTYYKKQFTGKVQVDWFKRSADGNSWQPAFVRAITFMAKTGGGTVECTPGKEYYCPAEFYLPSNVILEGNNCTLRGAASGTGTIIKTGFLTGGVVVDNTSSTPETQIVTNAIIRNFIITNAHTGIHMYNMILGCIVENIRFSNVTRSIYAKKCFYTIYRNMWSTGASSTGVFTYHFDDSCNAVFLERMTATKESCFLFENGCTAVTIASATTEGGTVGMKFKGDCLGFHIAGHYAEAIKDVYDFSELNTGFFGITGGYYNTTDRVIVAPSSSSNLSGYFDETNTIVNIGAVLGGYTYRGRVELSGGRNYMKVSKLPTADNTLTIPANYITDDTSNLETVDRVKISGTTVASANLLSRGVIPLRRQGDTGAGYTNWVAGATHAASGNDAAFNIVFTTKIKYRAFNMFIRYLIRINIGGVFHDIYGDIYGFGHKRQDSSDRTVTIDNDGNADLRITIGSFANAGMAYTATGSIQIL